MANPWANWDPSRVRRSNRVTGRAARNEATNTSNVQRSNGPTGFYTWWRPSQNSQNSALYNNAVTRSLERVGGNAVTNALGTLTSPGGPGGGGYGGGGGGGGGTPAVTQAMIDALAQALGVQGQQLTWTNLPAFQGQRLGAFNAAPYQQQQTLLNQAYNRDVSNIGANQAAVTQAVQQANGNPYANAQVQAGPATPVVGANLMGTAGAAADPAAAQQANAQNAQNQGTFQDLLNVLSANQQASNQSRVGQVAMDANYGRQALAAQAAGMRGGIATQQAQAAQQWAQQQAERDYQNNLMMQQWARENAQGRQQVAQTNWQQQQTNLQNRLQPVLDLIARSAGIPGLNMAPLMAALRGAGGVR